MPYPLPLRPPVMGLVLFLAGQLVGGLAEPFNGFQFLPHGLHVNGVHLLLGVQQVELAPPFLGSDFLGRWLSVLLDTGRCVIEDQSRLWRCSNSSRFSGFTLASCLWTALYCCTAPTSPALGEGGDPALGLDDFSPAGHSRGCSYRKFFHGAAAWTGYRLPCKKLTGRLSCKARILPVRVSGPLELLLGLPQVNHAGLLALRLLCLGLRPVVEAGMRALISLSNLLSAAICRLTLPCRCGYRASPSGCRWPQVDRGDFINTLSLVAAVVYQCRLTGGLQCPVGIGRPCRPPNLHIPLCRSSRWYPPGGSSSRLSRPGYVGRSRLSRMPCGTSRPMRHFLSGAGRSA